VCTTGMTLVDLVCTGCENLSDVYNWDDIGRPGMYWVWEPKCVQLG
jgi:hypothetical protein